LTIISNYISSENNQSPSVNKSLRDSAEEAFSEYFGSLNGHAPVEFYQTVLKEVEQPLFRAVMSYTRGNQSRAADILGINRGTLRKKLKTYGMMS